MSDFFNHDEPYEAERSYEYRLADKKQEIRDAWLLVQNEAECDFEDADLDKMIDLLEELKGLREDKENIIGCIDAQREVRYARGSI